MARTEFSMKTKRLGWERAGGVCECGCKRPFGKHPKERPDYDHILPDALGGDNSLENLQVIRHDCHLAKTATRDIKQIAKARRGEKDRAGLRAKRSSFPGAKTSKYKAKIGGGWEIR
jgi:5-methylcytosine-specific restriction enzyme A